MSRYTPCHSVRSQSTPPHPADAVRRWCPWFTISDVIEEHVCRRTVLISRTRSPFYDSMTQLVLIESERGRANSTTPARHVRTTQTIPTSTPTVPLRHTILRTRCVSNNRDVRSSTMRTNLTNVSYAPRVSSSSGSGADGSFFSEAVLPSSASSSLLIRFVLNSTLGTFEMT